MQRPSPGASTKLYEKLEHHDSIRLFKLCPSAQDTDQVEGELITVRRSENPEYRALSYMWGPADPSREQQLNVSGCSLPVRSNLASALHAYRTHLRDGRVRQNIPLWIDLICIHQNDMEEKNHQVQQMGAIYRQARSVLVWLGHETEEPLSNYYHGPWFSLLNLKTAEEDMPQDPGNLRLLFWALLNRHWSRTWILQEICLARKIAIFTQNSVFKDELLQRFQTDRVFLHETLASFWHASGNNSNPHASAVRLIDRFLKIWTVRESRQDPRWKPLSLSSTIYQLAVDSECMERRDKVFAFLDMCSFGDQVTVDYDKDEVTMFWEVLQLSPIQELDYQEIDSLREVLELTWKRLLFNTALQIVRDDTLARLRLPCSLDCGTLSNKNNRSRQLRRSCRPCSFTMNCWLQTGLESSESMFQMQLVQAGSDTYLVKDIKFCVGAEDRCLVGGILAQQCSVQMLDETWTHRRETAAVDPLLYCMMHFFATVNTTVVQSLDLKRAIFTTFGKSSDEFCKFRKQSKHFGMPLRQSNEKAVD